MEGDRIRELRKARNWRAEDLAEKSGVSYRTIVGLESPGGQNTTTKTLEDIARALDVELAELFGAPHREDPAVDMAEAALVAKDN